MKTKVNWDREQCTQFMRDMPVGCTIRFKFNTIFANLTRLSEHKIRVVYDYGDQYIGPAKQMSGHFFSYEHLSGPAPLGGWTSTETTSTITL